MERKNNLLKLQKISPKYYKFPYLDTEEIIEILDGAKFIKRFFTKLHKNKDINVNLLVNNLILLYNCFDREFMNRYLVILIEPEHHMYLKTILLYMKKININHPWYKHTSISYDFDYLLNTINKRNF